jgi:hypothetical protein
MGRKILAMASALITAWGFLLIGKMIATDVGWTPNSLEFMSRSEVSAYFSTQPLGTYITLLIGSMIAAYFGGYIVTEMSRRESPGILLSMLTGAILIFTGCLNFFVFLPGQPAWLVVATLLSYIPMTLVGHYSASGFGHIKTDIIGKRV